MANSTSRKLTRSALTLALSALLCSCDSGPTPRAGDLGLDPDQRTIDMGTAETSPTDAAPRDAPRLDAAPSDAVPAPDAPVGPPVAYKGVTAAMWAEIKTQRAAFGDPNDCPARIAKLPASGKTLSPCSGSCIQSALASSSAVILKGGTYSISSTIKLGGKSLVGAAGAYVLINAAGVDKAVDLGSGGAIANVWIVDAENIGVAFGSDSLAYRVSVGRTGYSSKSNTAGFGFSVSGGSNNCIVSTEAFDGYNEDGASCTPCYNGGNADGYAIKFDASQNTMIDCHAFRNSDDGYDFWMGKTAYVYFSTAFDAGKTPGKTGADGNGIKLGKGSAMHYLYKSSAYNNKSNGFDLNGNTITSTLIKCTAYGNGGKDFAGVTSQ